MNLSQKCQYAVRAVLELAIRYGQGVVSAGEIAAAQAIPQRFLEIILNELRPPGFVVSRRGIQGGYFLGRSPSQITVGQIIREVEGPMDPVRCEGGGYKKACKMREGCCLMEMWDRARTALESVYDGTTFEQLAQRHADLKRTSNVDYTI